MAYLDVGRRPIDRSGGSNQSNAFVLCIKLHNDRSSRDAGRMSVQPFRNGPHF